MAISKSPRYVQALFKRTEQYTDRVRQHFATAIDELIKISTKNGKWSPEGFAYSQNKKLSAESTKILRQLYSAVYNEIKQGVQAEWSLANIASDELVKSVWGNSVKEANNNFMARYFQRNQEAMDAFYARKSQHGGLSLSQKVWKYVGDLRNEMELALSLSMGQGESASSMSRKVRQFLQNPDSMFRRFRVKTGEETIYDADGNPIGTKPIYGRQWKRKVTDPKTGEVHWENYNPKNYHPGAGVYRSSYKNAMRLCRTETNMAYRASEQLRWQQMDFIIGYEVHLSNNHPEYDICNELAGQYPKDFKFTGWHPQCRCYVTPIIMNREERFKLYEAQDNGQEYHSPREIKQMPRKFTEWQKRNAERIKKADEKGTLPYFLRDNGRIVGGKWVLGKTNGKPSGTVVKSAELGKGTIVPSAKVQDALVPRCEAKTAQEAADYIKTYIADNVTMPIKKGDLPLLNEYLTHISQRMKEFGMERFSVVGVPESRKAMASFSRQNNSYNLNMSALRNYKKQWEGEMKWRKKGIRYLAFESEEDVVRHALDHELGHKLLYQYKMKGEAEKMLTTAFREIDTVVGNYASTNADELFAECFAMYLGPGRNKMVQTKEMIEKMVEKVDRGGHFGSFAHKPTKAKAVKIVDFDVVDMDENLSNTKTFAEKLSYSESEINLIKQKPLSIADRGMSNALDDGSIGFENNCQLCVPTLLARFRGLNVAAKKYVDAGYIKDLSNDMTLAYKTTKGESVVTRKFADADEVRQCFDHELKKNGLYQFGYDLRIGNKEGHTVFVVRKKGATYIIDDQLEGYMGKSIEDYLQEISFNKKVELLRIDNLNFDERFMECVERL